MDTQIRLVQGQRFTRLLTLEPQRAVVDTEARTAELAFSSESPYERSWGVEILDHDVNSIQLDRLANGGPLLMDHDAKDVVGVIEEVRIGPDRVGRARVRFGRGARASEVFQDVVDGIRRNVSVGYVIHEAALEDERDGVGTYRVTRWEPFEVSLVAVPADSSVGVGRSAAETEADAPDGLENQPADDAPAEAPEVAADLALDADPNPSQENQMEDQIDVTVADRSADAKTIAAIGQTFAKQGGVEAAMEAIQRGDSAEQFRTAFMEKLAARSKPVADIGMTKAETNRYSFLRAINALANPQDQRAQNAAAFELEASRSAAEQMGRSSRGITIPQDVLRRDLMTSPASAGGATVSTDLLAQDFITLLRNQMVLSGLGTRMMTGLVGNIAIPRQTGAASAYWVNEGVAPTESQQAFDQVTMSPKTLASVTDLSRKILLQSAIDIEAQVRGDLARQIGLAIEQAAINGSGISPVPLGILQDSSVNIVALGTNGGELSWDAVVNMESEVATRNADIGSLNYLTNAKVCGKLKRTFVDGPGSGERVWSGTSVNGYNAAVTNSVPSNLSKGTGNNLSALIFGNWNDLMIGMWGALDLMVDPYTASSSGTVRVVALQDVDVALRHPESFAVIKDAKTG